MSDDTPSLVVEVDAQYSKFQKAMGDVKSQSEKAVGDIEDKFEKANPSFAGIENGLKRLLGGVAIGAIVGQIKSVTAEVAHMGGAAERVGLSTDDFQKLQYAIVATGGNAASAGAGLDRFSRSISEAARGSGELYQIFAKNNVALKDAQGNLLPTNELLDKAANLIGNAKNAQDRMNLSVQLFGRNAGPEMARALAQGADGLKRFGDQAEESGVVIDKELIERAKQINARFETLAMRTGVLFKEAAVAGAGIISGARDLISGDLFGNADAIVRRIQSLSAAIKEAETEGDQSNQRKAEVDGYIGQLNTLRQSLKDINAERAKANRPPILENAPATNVGTVTNPTLLPDVQDVAFQKLLERQRERIGLLNAETQTIGLTVGEQEKLKTQITLESEARRQNIPLTDDRRAAIAREAEAMGEAAKKLQEYRDRFAATNDVLRFGGSQIVDVLEAATQKGFRFGDAMATVLRNVSKELLQASITGEGAFAKILGMNSQTGGVGGILGLLGRAFGGGLGGAAPGAGSVTVSSGAASVIPLTGIGGIGHAATGGSFNAGDWSVVGEKGPEIVRFGRDATVYPNGVTPAQMKMPAQIVPAAVARSGGGDTHVSVGGATVNVQGSVDEKTIPLIMGAIEQYDKRTLSRWVSSAREAKRRSLI